MGILRPSDIDELRDIVASAASAGTTLALCGGGSHAEVGVPTRAEMVDMRGFSGIIDYDPAELVLTVGAGTLLGEVQLLLAEHRQSLAFDPFDVAPLFGQAPGRSTIGGVVASGTAGSGRLSGGAVRDHLLGFKAVSGRGEMFVAGAKVVKNVTGYDLPKLVAGSWGRLVALTELTLKVLPRPRECVTRIFTGQSPSQTAKIFATAMGSQAGIAAAAHIPGHLRDGQAITALRMEGFGPSVQARTQLLDRVLDDLDGHAICPEDGAEVWNDMRTLAPLADGKPLWRVSIPPSACSGFLAIVRPAGARYLIDWAGARVWLTFDGPASTIREAAASLGGHALLMRADRALRMATPALHPQPAPLAALEARVRRAFDPAGVFETGRF